MTVIPIYSIRAIRNGKKVVKYPGLQEIESIILNDIDKYEVQRNLCRIALEGSDMLSVGQLEKEILRLQRSSEISLNKANSKLAIIRRGIAYETAKRDRPETDLRACA
jgi:hypothetical protein